MSPSPITVIVPFPARRAEAVRSLLEPFGNLARPALPEAAAALRAALDRAGAHTVSADLAGADGPGIVHFLSLNVLEPPARQEAHEEEGPAPKNGGADDASAETAHLLVEITADGAAGPALAAVADVLDEHLPGLRAAMGLDRDPRATADLLAAHRHEGGPGWSRVVGLPFSGTPGMSVARIKAEARLAQDIRARLPRLLRDGSALEALGAVRRGLWDDEARKWAFTAAPIPWLPAPEPSPWRAFVRGGFALLWPLLVGLAVVFGLRYAYEAVWAGRGWTGPSPWAALWFTARVALVLLAALAVLGGAAWYRLRRLERLDPADDRPAAKEAVEAVMARENHGAQNHLFAVSTLKPDPLRRLTLRLAFTAIEAAAAATFRPGHLGDLGTIHFARWVLVPGTDALVFLSNYGGSWESYLEDFIEKAHLGLTGVWSNTVGFPRARNLFWEGATDGNRFKRWARRQQRPTLLWYSAYPELTTGRIRANALVRQGIANATTEGEATDWLSLFGAAPRRPADIEAPEVPALVFGGFSPLPYGQALLLRLRAAGAKAWLRAMEEDGPGLSFGDARPKGIARLLAFSAEGLGRLGLSQRDLATFPTAFQAGMTAPERARALGDQGEDAPESWAWGGPANPVDAVLLVYAESAEMLAAAVAECRKALRDHGQEEAWSVTFAPVERQRLISRPQLADDKYTRNDDLNREAFGFADGISQPIIRGTRRWIAMRDANHVVEPGEIVLGYPDNRRRLPPSPSVLAADDPDHLLPSFGSDPFRERPDFSRPQPTSERDFGRNGAFLVVRQLAQDKSGFRRFVEAAARRLDGDARAPADPVRRREWIMAKLVGRWPDGTSLVRYPHAPGTADDRLARPDNDFLYGADDRSGLRCPLGAHIRRMNPRDSLAPEQAETIAITNRHRILRVGRNYKKGREAGIFFMCLNADIERQFEFVQQTWARGSAFHGLDNEVDCLAPRGATSCISIPTPEGSIVLERMKNFVAVRGGGYFFMPGRRAIRFLIRAGLDQDRTTMTTSAAADPTSAPLEPVRA